MEEQAIELPELPRRVPGVCVEDGIPGFVPLGYEANLSRKPVFTIDTMQAYARAAVLAERERCAKVCEALIDPQDEDDGRDYCLRTVAAAIRKG